MVVFIISEGILLSSTNFLQLIESNYFGKYSLDIVRQALIDIYGGREIGFTIFRKQEILERYIKKNKSFKGVNKPNFDGGSRIN